MYFGVAGAANAETALFFYYLHNLVSVLKVLAARKFKILRDITAQGKYVFNSLGLSLIYI